MKESFQEHLLRPNLSHLGPEKKIRPANLTQFMRPSGISNSLKIISPTLLNTQVRVDLGDLLFLRYKDFQGFLTHLSGGCTLV